jgi:hypothetical protein
MSDGDAPTEVKDQTATFREAREYARGRLDVDHHQVHPIAGLIEDDRVRRVLGWMSEIYDPSREEVERGLPRDFWETAIAQRAVRAHATEALSKAIKQGNVTQAAYFSGLPSYKSDVSGLHAINQLSDWLVHSEQCKLVYLAALMGRGKTDLSCTMMEVVADHYDRLDRSLGSEVDVPTPEFGANFSVDAPDHEVLHIDNFDDLLEWGERGSSDDVRWFVFDEASTELTAQSGANAQDVAEIMAPFVKKMRKMGINMIVVGHDKGDIHVAIRSLADYVDKQGLKTASFYAGISKREPTGHLFDLSGIPPTSWEFDTDDTAEWSWGSAVEDGDVDEGMSDSEFKSEVAERAARVWLRTPDSVSQRDVADAISNDRVSVSPATISNYASDIDVDKQPAKATVGD